MKVRLAEIAERAGVSVSTVSRVLNEKAGVNPLTRKQVLTALDVLGYDRPARLRPRAAGLVGLIVPELENPFFPTFAQLVETNLARHGYTPVLCSQTLGGVHEDDYVRILLEHGVAGIIFVSGIHARSDCDPERYRRLAQLGLPFVLVNGYHEEIPAASFSTDDRAGMDLAVAHLASMGHRHIGLALGQPRYTPVQRKEAGFRDAMHRHVPGVHDQDLDATIEFTTFTLEGGTLAARLLVARGVTAVICGSDIMALGAIRAIRQVGLRVPEDVSVVGSDDGVLNEFCDPPLTSLRQPATALATAVCRALVDQIGGQQIPATDLLFQPELVVRSSTTRVARGPLR